MGLGGQYTFTLRRKFTVLPAEGFSSGTQALNLMEQLSNNILPKGISYDWTATSFQEKQVGSQACFIYALSITLVFMVLAALYESWTSPLAVVLVCPHGVSRRPLGFNDAGL